ncbi:protein of unknown function [Methylorubrum extorquens]|uniref:Uncharacterized protein n=1 Tax=Methylorubrum extorquens TaxID=408 RepID=A0A2N9AIE9_METEX|nr:protein of unknown function [Methylorubrum extorquens]
MSLFCSADTLGGRLFAAFAISRHRCRRSLCRCRCSPGKLWLRSGHFRYSGDTGSHPFRVFRAVLHRRVSRAPIAS